MSMATFGMSISGKFAQAAVSIALLEKSDMILTEPMLSFLDAVRYVGCAGDIETNMAQ